jgi:hypothetical protein
MSQIIFESTVSTYHTNADIHHIAMQETLVFVYTHIQSCFSSLSFIMADVSDNMFIIFCTAHILVSIFKQCVSLLLQLKLGLTSKWCSQRMDRNNILNLWKTKY